VKGSAAPGEPRQVRDKSAAIGGGNYYEVWNELAPTLRIALCDPLGKRTQCRNPIRPNQSSARSAQACGV